MKEIREIGRGGFGVVHEVEDVDGNRYAKKTYSFNQPTNNAALNENAKKRFTKEARLQSAIEHRNIVSVLSTNLNDEPPSFTMPLAEGSLAQDIQADKTLSGNYIIALLDVIGGLEELHSLDICHRDLKPQNVLRFSYDDSDGVQQSYYAISDFGLVSLKETQFSALTTTGMAMGSDFYTAPEITQQLRDASPQSDIYSVGCILHDFVGTKSRIPCNEIREDSGNFAGILLNCTRSDPVRRFKSIAAVREAILSVLDEEGPIQVEHSDSSNLLNAGRDLTQVEWEHVVTFIEDNESKPDGQTAIRTITLEHIESLFNVSPILCGRLGIVFANWARDGGFVFEYCDGLADKLELFIHKCSLTVQAECLMAMLYMGVGHNRWLVEWKFHRMAGPSMDVNFSKRVAVEFRADSERTCRSINHLERSISVSRNSLHPYLIKTLEEICS